MPEFVFSVAQAFEKKGDFDVDAAQVINNKKVSDHHAIIPTQSMTNADLQELPAGERAVLQLISVRFLVAVSKAHSYSETTMEVTCADAVFTAKGKAVREEGWDGKESKRYSVLNARNKRRKKLKIFQLYQKAMCCHLKRWKSKKERPVRQNILQRNYIVKGS